MTHDDLARLQEEPLPNLSGALLDRFTRVKAEIARWEPRPMPDDWPPTPRSTR